MLRLAATIALGTLLLAGCGRSGEQEPQTPVPQTQQPTEQATTERPEEDAPAASPDAWRKVTAAPLDGWHALSPTSRDEVMKRFGEVPAGLRYVASMTSVRAPGATAPEERWAEWLRQASSAVLFFMAPEQRPGQDAIDELDGKLFNSDGERHHEGNHVWALSAGGDTMIIALNNDNGLYIVCVALAGEGTPDDDLQLIRGWVANIQPQQEQ